MENFIIIKTPKRILEQPKFLNLNNRISWSIIFLNDNDPQELHGFWTKQQAEETIKQFIWDY